MATIQVEVTPEQLLRAVEQLPADQLVAFAEQVLALRARQLAPSLAHDEAALLAVINEGLLIDVQRRYDALIARRQAEVLTPEEHSELLKLSDEIEQLDAERVGALSELASLRGTTLAALMHSLGIQPPTYA